MQGDGYNLCSLAGHQHGSSRWHNGAKCVSCEQGTPFHCCLVFIFSVIPGASVHGNSRSSAGACKNSGSLGCQPMLCTLQLCVHAGCTGEKDSRADGNTKEDHHTP